MFDWLRKNEKLRNRVETSALVVIALLILLLGIQVAEGIRGHNALTKELLLWAQQQRQIMIQQAQQQGIIQPQAPPVEEVQDGEDSGPAETTGGGTTPRKPN